MWIDHLGISIANVNKSRDFYSSVLPTIGLELVAEVEDAWLGYGKGQKAEFWFGEEEDGSSHAPMHIAFAADSRDQVDAFYAAAIAAGAECNGKPGVREIYHPDYYGAFVLDPDGHNIEAVCHSADLVLKNK